MSATARRRHPVYASDIRALGGTVCVVKVRNRIDPGEPQFRVDYVSRGRDLAWTSLPIADEDQARAASRAIAEFTGGVVVQ
jgi:hypothetical protein